MNMDELSSDEVPQKFADWLLAMGCPADKVPPLEKVARMCRGQYMVWRSLMKHVEPKDVIRQKRLQVFHDDIHRCKNAHIHDSKVVIPSELTAWRQHRELTEQVAAAEKRVQQARDTLETVMNKVSSKLAQSNISRQSASATARRAWLLQCAAAEFTMQRDNLQQIRPIADELCHGCDETNDDEIKIDKCLSHLMKQSPLPRANASLSMYVDPEACSTVVSTGSEDTEELLSVLDTIPAQSLWRSLIARCNALVDDLAAANAEPADRDTADTIGPQSVLAATRALHCALCLDTMKQRELLARTRDRLELAVADVNNVTDESSELLVLRCERACAEARLAALRCAAADVAARGGAFRAAGPAQGAQGEPGDGGAGQLLAADRAIVAKKQEIKAIMSSLLKTERKTLSVRESLNSVFRSFRADLTDNRGNVQRDLPHESMASIRQFYSGRVCRGRNDLTLCPDSLECSDVADMSEPSLVDELRVYLNRFNLEKNRKLVLENGEKIWIFETLHSSTLRLHSSLLSDDVTCSLVCPSVSLARNLRRLAGEARQARQGGESARRGVVRAPAGAGPRGVLGGALDIASVKEAEEKQMDKIKKRLNSNILSLQKTTKALEVGQENLQFWSENRLRKYVSTNRAVCGKGYREYEALYLDSRNPFM